MLGVAVSDALADVEDVSLAEADSEGVPDGEAVLDAVLHKSRSAR